MSAKGYCGLDPKQQCGDRGPAIWTLYTFDTGKKMLFLHIVEGVVGTLRPYWSEATMGSASVVEDRHYMLKLCLLALGRAVMAIGDGENVIEMIELASLGIALNNGSEN
ncbi:endoribonuclease YBEY, chloroplastic [Tanacetum coccineum]